MGRLTSVQNLRFFRPSVKCREVTHQKIMSDNKEIGKKYGIHPRDVEKVKFAFDVYDFKGDGKVDGFYIGDLLRACNLNPTLATIDEVGGMKEKGKKIMVIDDFYPIFAKVKLLSKSNTSRQYLLNEADRCLHIVLLFYGMWSLHSWRPSSSSSSSSWHRRPPQARPQGPH